MVVRRFSEPMVSSGGSLASSCRRVGWGWAVLCSRVSHSSSPSSRR